MNNAFLTNSHAAIAAKKKAKRTQIKEILFDDEARREFLTGFHKRKLAKADAARKKAAAREKEDHLEARREQRRMLRERAAENAAQVERAYGAISDEEEWDGISDKGKQKEQEHDYEDEQVVATVAVVEDFDPDSIIYGESEPNPSATSSVPRPPSQSSKPPVSKNRPSKPKSKKVRYQTKDARRADRVKQRGRRTEKAELAGGKASRKSKGKPRTRR
ncbi:nucleolar protein 12-domain-containing protein [Mycena floridula]|nr:nucleolar protein 12-domain-containing protein [Mycena floridula]